MKSFLEFQDALVIRNVVARVKRGSKGGLYGKYPDHIVEEQLQGKCKTKEEASKPGGALHETAVHAREYANKLQEVIKLFSFQVERTDGQGVSPTTVSDLKKLMRDAEYVGSGLASHTKNVQDLTDWDDRDIAPLWKPSEEAKKAGGELKGLAGKAPNVKDPSKGRAVMNYAEKVKAAWKKFNDAVSEYEKTAKS